MDVLTAVCLRLLGDDQQAARCAARAREASGAGAQLAAALEACRSVRGPTQPQGAGGTEAAQSADLRTAVAGELSAAAFAVPERQQEALALRDVAGLSYADLSEVLAIEPTVVAALLTHARLGFRAELRGEIVPQDGCAERDRALSAITLRLDGEDVTDLEEDWLIEHLGECPGCQRAHASLLESAACYRSWPAPIALS